MNDIVRRALALALLVALALTVGVAGCDQAGGESAPGERLAIEIAPLSYPSVSNALYELHVTNAAGDTVWSRQLSADAYGDGAGSLSYVGPCDADSNPNAVSVELLALYAGAGGTSLIPADAWQSPGVLSREITCEPNRDVDVSCNLTIVRQADQGFFDIAVAFKDVFCSAKLACQGSDGEPLRLLFDASGVRNATVVMAVA